ncbi:MAG: hypothetical protein M3R15_17970, partial [Acidobacteriota bacterium]|nr:hypothetical protein [Acidobacteriota bacterium]
NTKLLMAGCAVPLARSFQGRPSANPPQPSRQPPQTPGIEGEDVINVQTCIRKDIPVSQQETSSCELMPKSDGGAGAATKRGESAMYGANKRNQIEKRLEQDSSVIGNTAKGVEADRVLPQQYRVRSMKPDLTRGKTTVAAVMDMRAGKMQGTPPKSRGETVVRFDGLHKNAPTPHINIDRRPPGIKDPPTPISSHSLRVAGSTARTLEALSKVARPVAIITDTVRLGAAIHADGNTVGKNTAVTAGSVAGGWAGAAGGAWLGAKGGAMAGAAIGGVIGGIVGGIGGAFLG